MNEAQETCPFCGEWPIAHQSHWRDAEIRRPAKAASYGIRVLCNNPECSIRPFTGQYPTGDEAWAAWGKRVDSA